MSETQLEDMKFQFQIAPGETRRIRKIVGVPAFSYKFVLFFLVAGYCLGGVLLVRADAWELLAFTGIVYLILIYRGWRQVVNPQKKLGPINQTILFDDVGVVGMQDSSESKVAWTGYHELIETDDYFVLRIYESATALPKRVLTQDQISSVRELIQTRISSHTNDRPDVDLFERFVGENDVRIYKFAWSREDRKQLSRCRFKALTPATQAGGRPANSWFGKGVWWMAIALVGWVTLSSFSHLLFGRLGQAEATRRSMIVAGAAIPVFLGVIAFMIQRLRLRNQFVKARLPTDQARVCLANDSMVMGMANSASRYALSDIGGFYFDNNFIGFQSSGGGVLALPSRAFGGNEAALQFIRNADRKRNEILNQNSEKTPSVTQSENPYQSPQDGSRK